MAPTTQYINAPASQPTPPAAGFAGFRAMAGCTPANYKVVPNECSYLDPTYWQKLDSIVKDANDGLYKDAKGVDKTAGIVVVVSGVIDPTDRGGPGTTLTPLQKYPRKEAAEAFARQLAARLAGSFVFFSPGFDDKRDELLDDGLLKVQDSMAAVGPALHSAAPRHLAGNQLAGGEDITYYDTFHEADWLSFEFYQSGHKGNQGLPCNYTGGEEYARAVCRARELTLRFRCQGAASTVKNCPTGANLPPGSAKPAVNSEGAYEDFSTTANDPDTREGERHTAYVSALSGSFGYTIGVLGIRDWSNPGIYSDSYQNDKSQADGDLGRLGGLFRGSPWTDLEPRHNLIANNPPVNTLTSPIATNQPPANEKKRMVLAGNTSYALIYVPGIDPKSPTSVQISTGLSNSLTGLSCSTCWGKKWASPRPNESEPTATCTTGNGFITIRGSLGCPTGSSSCDWVLRLTKGTSASCKSSNATAAAPTAKSELLLNDLEVWTELSEDSLTSAVLAQAFDSDGIEVADPVVVSPDGTSFQKLPTAARDSIGNFFVTWEAQSPDTGLDEIWARRYDNDGNPLSDPFLVSPPAEGQQAEPSVTADSSDNVTVSWTRHDQVDDDGEITLQAYEGTGSPVADPVSLPPTLDGGAATMSLVQADGQGNLWIAWTTEDRKHGGGNVYAQRLLKGGVLSGRPFRVNTTHVGVGRLADLEVKRDGSFRVVWEGLGPNGRGKGLRERRYDGKGHPLEDETPVSSPN